MDKIGDEGRYWQLSQAAYACARAAWERGDEEAAKRAGELHRKYVHRWRQAVARAARTPISTPAVAIPPNGL
jgi:hypothetical protein